MTRRNRRTRDLPDPDMEPLTEESLRCLRNLRAYTPPPEPCPHLVPAYRRAAVLLGLFGARHGDLYVILSRRSVNLRSHGGDTAIPGGRYELGDGDLEATARREAFEETGLPVDPRKAVKLCELEPFLSANELVVTPVVVFLADPMIKPSLNPDEVSALFSLPFSAFLRSEPDALLRHALHLDDPFSPMRPTDPNYRWHTSRDIRWLGGRTVRRHTFHDPRNPVRGLTSDILVRAAAIAYDRSPSFLLTALCQPSQAELIRLAFASDEAIRKRRVRPRMQIPGQQQYGPMDQPKDEVEGRGRDATAGEVWGTGNVIGNGQGDGDGVDGEKDGGSREEARGKTRDSRL